MGFLIAAAGLGLAWLLLAAQMRFHWGGETYYNYGWAVPFLALFLLYRRGVQAPEPDRQEPVVWLWSLAVCVALVVALVPFRGLAEVNPFWRKPVILQALMLVAATWVLAYGAGGRRTWYHYAFPVFFLLTMVPWPYQIEVVIIQALTGKVVAVTTEVLRFLGYPATIAGRIIQIGDQTVGVDEACSGIRSLQALGMVALFVGEYFMLTVVRRCALLVLTLAVVIVFNVARSLTLTLVVLSGGQEAYQKWHDPTGYVSFLASLLVLYFAADLLARGRGARELESECETWRDRLPLVPVPAASWVLPLVALVGAALVEGWFRYHERHDPGRVQWSLVLPEAAGEDEVQILEIPPTVENLLSYDYATRAWFRLPNLKSADVYFYGYTGENRVASVSSYGHSPRICMEAAGARLRSEQAPLQIASGPLELPMRHFIFDVPVQGGDFRTSHVFWCVWENNNMGIDPDELASLTFANQLKQALRGRRDFSRQVILVAINGAVSVDAARATLRELLSGLIVVGDAPELAQR